MLRSLALDIGTPLISRLGTFDIAPPRPRASAQTEDGLPAASPSVLAGIRDESSGSPQRRRPRGVTPDGRHFLFSHIGESSEDGTSDVVAPDRQRFLVITREEALVRSTW
jgi:hypothetical protein